MKFNKRFSAYVQTQQALQPGLSYVHFKRLKKLLKRCTARRHHHHHHHHPLPPPPSPSPSSSSPPPASPSSSSPASCCSSAPLDPAKCPPSCTVCDGAFFPELMNEVAGVMGCFSARVQALLHRHLPSSGMCRYLLRFLHPPQPHQDDMAHEGQKLVAYAYMNALAIRKILKKYDKVHRSRKGRAFKNRLQMMHVQLLQSPWLVELIALHLNLKATHPSPHTWTSASDGFLSASCTENLESSKPTISCTLSDAVNIEIDLTCSICLDMVFDPVSLGCGHIFCNSCACSAALIPTVAGLKAADRNTKCPLCRQARVYEDAVHLSELGTLISSRCQDYWSKRLQKERVERLEQAKKHWDGQCRAMLGM